MGKRKQKKKTVNNRLDKLWSSVTKQLQPTCEVCGVSQPLNSHHFIGRVNRTLRWDIRNCVVLCVAHHKFGKNSAHEDPQWFVEWFKTNRPEDYQYISENKNNIIKRSIEDLLVIEGELKQLQST